MDKSPQSQYVILTNSLQLKQFIEIIWESCLGQESDTKSSLCFCKPEFVHNKRERRAWSGLAV